MKTKRVIQRQARRLFRLCRVGGLLDETRVRKVMAATQKSGRRNRLGLLEEFHRLVMLDDVRRSATIQSAIELSEELNNKVRSDLERLYGKGLRMTFVKQPELIAGMRIKVGSHVYDGSVKGRLNNLESRF
jgi:F-type H+-transporting ATPase subunit delta